MGALKTSNILETNSIGLAGMCTRPFRPRRDPRRMCPRRAFCPRRDVLDSRRDWDVASPRRISI